MSLFGVIVVFVCVWWVLFFAALPMGVRRPDRVGEGMDPGAPARPMLLKKAVWTTVAAVVLVGGAALLEEAGVIAVGAWLFGLPS